MKFLDKLTLRDVPRMAEDGGGAAAATGSAAGGASGTAAAGAAAAATGAGASAAAAGAGAAAGSAPWYTSKDYGFDEPTTKFFEGKNYPDAKTALTSLRHADEVARSRNVLTKPDPKNLQAWDGYSDLGWTADRSKYAIEPPKLNAGEKHDEAGFATFQALAHEAKIAPWQAKAIYDGMHAAGNKALNDARVAAANANKELDTKLREKWPGAVYDQKVELGKRAFATLSVDGLTGSELDQAFGSPRVVELFARLGEMMGEDKLVTDRGTQGRNDHPSTIEAQLTRFEQDPENIKIMNDQRNPLYNEVVAKRRDLIAKLAAAQANRR